MEETENSAPKGNPKGPIFVPKTFGIGWTLNFARWESFVILIILIAVIAGSFWFKNQQKGIIFFNRHVGH